MRSHEILITMNNDDINQFKKICLKVKGSFVNNAWDFDSRFNSLLIVFDSAIMNRIMHSLDDGFANRWDRVNIKKASRSIKKLVKTIYGIESGQFIFSEENEDHDMALYAAWWPWGNGEQISLRISIFSPQKNLLSDNEIKEYLVEWFDL